MNQSLMVWRARLRQLRPFVLGLSTLLLLGILVNELTTVWDRLIKGRPCATRSPSLGEWLTIAGLVGLLGLCSWGWHRLTKELLQARTRYYRRRLATEDPRSHLVLFLSNLNTRDGELQQNATGDCRPLAIPLTTDLDADLESLLRLGTKSKWPWEQMLRALRPHRAVLKAVYCLCSRESLPQAAGFRAILDNYGIVPPCEFWIVIPGRVVSSYSPGLAPDPNGLDFENYDALTTALRMVFQRLKTEGVPEHSVMVDFTGGTKVASVAAVATTYDCEINAQYVQTTDPKEVYCYDVILQKMRLDVPHA